MNKSERFVLVAVCLSCALGLLYWNELLFSAQDSKEISHVAVIEIKLSLFYPETEQDRFLNGLLITDQGVIEDFESDRSGDLTFHPIPKDFTSALNYTTFHYHREYLERKKHLAWFVKNGPKQYFQYTTATQVNFLINPIASDHGQFHTYASLQSSLNSLGVRALTNAPITSSITTHIILDYLPLRSSVTEMSLQDELLFLYGFSPKMDPSGLAKFTLSNTIFIKATDIGFDVGYQLIEGKGREFELRPWRKPPNSKMLENPCSDKTLLLVHSRVEPKLILNRAKELQSKFLEWAQIPETKFRAPPEKQQYLKYWEALMNYSNKIHSATEKSFLVDVKITQYGWGREFIKKMNLVQFLSDFVWVPTVKYLTSDCHESDALSKIVTAQSFPISPVPDGVDLRRFFPTSRYWSETRRSKVLVVSEYISEPVEVVREWILEREPNVEFVYLDLKDQNADELVEAAKSSQFGLIFDWPATKMGYGAGVALEDLLGMDLPLFVFRDRYAPYFPSSCGAIYLDSEERPVHQEDHENPWEEHTLDSLTFAFERFYSQILAGGFSPRRYVADNLSYGSLGANFLQTISPWLRKMDVSCGYPTPPRIQCLDGEVIYNRFPSKRK